MCCDNKSKRIAVVQRVIFHYRMGLFQEMSRKWTVKVFHGESVIGSKVINAKPPYCFQTQKLFTICKKAKKNPQQILFFNPGLVLALWSWKPDVIILEGSNNMLNNIVVYLFCKLFRKKFIWWGIGRVPGRKDSLYRKFLTPFRKLLIREAYTVLSYCNLSAEYFGEITDRNKIRVFPNSLHNKALEKEITQITEEDKEISGDIFISFERIKENSEKFNESIDCELSRVSIHGILHLVGYNDCDVVEKAEMRKMEDYYLSKKIFKIVK